MLTKTRLLATLMLCCASVGATVPVALGAAAKPATPAAILNDCKRDGVISKKYRLTDLRKAQKTAKSNKKKYRVCTAGLTSAVAALSGKPGRDSVSAIVRECAVSNGAIKHKYKLATLRKAAKKLPSDVKQYTSCGDLIASQIHTLA